MTKQEIKLIFFKLIFIILNLLYLSSCGNKLQEGVFLDCPVEGLEYKTETTSGLTDYEGTFQFAVIEKKSENKIEDEKDVENETIEFSIGGIVIGKTAGKDIITPLDLVKGAENEFNQTVTNICRFLISIDEDSNPENGIKISEDIRKAFAEKSLNFSVNKALFEEKIEELNLSDFVEESYAQKHFRKTLDIINQKKSKTGIKFKIHGLSINSFINNKNINNKISLKELSNKIEIIKDYTNWILTFTCTRGFENIGRVAKEYNLKVALGAKIDSDETTNNIEIASLIRESQAGYVDIAVVGNNVLSKKYQSQDQLIKYIKEVKEKAGNIEVAYADTYSIFLDNEDLINAIDIIILNIYPYNDGVDIDKAKQHVEDNFNRLKDNLNQIKYNLVQKDKNVIISGTGWPDSGYKINEAAASLINANKFFNNFINWAHKENIKYFYFEAFNNQYENTFFGIWDNNDRIKKGMNVVFENDQLSPLDVSYNSNNITIDKPENNNSSSLMINKTSTEKIHNNNKQNVEAVIQQEKEEKQSQLCDNSKSQADIIFTYVPPSGNRIKNLKGRVLNINNNKINKYKVIVYCYINNKWTIILNHNKAYIDIQQDGTWTCDITAKRDYDWNAARIIAFLIPENFNLLTIDELYSKDFPYTEVYR